MIKHSFQIAIAVTIIFLVGFTSQDLACSCRGLGPPCQAYWDSSVVFIGVPLNVSQIEVESDGHKVSKRLFRFRVEEAFRGTEGTELEILTGAWGGDCGIDFRLRTKYLVYGYKQSSARWVETSICTRTQPISDASEDLNYIRSIAKLSPGGSIYGTAQRYTVDLENGAWKPAGPIAGAVVVASSGERRFETMTSGDGHYNLSGLSPGRYTVRVTLPPKLSPNEDKTVEVRDRGCAEINYRSVIDGRIIGGLLDAQGRPQSIKTVNLLSVESVAEAFRPLWAITNEDGNFHFTNLPPGKYILGINIGDAPSEKLPYRKTFYPSTSDKSKAEVLSLSEGQHLVGIDFRLPQPLTARMIKGTVVWPDGRPAVNAEVSLKEIESGRLAGWYTKTDDKGHFELSSFEGIQYTITATIPADPNWDPDSGKAVELLVTREVQIKNSSTTTH